MITSQVSPLISKKQKENREKFLKAFQEKQIDEMMSISKWFRKRITTTNSDNMIVREFLNTGLIPYFIEILGYSDEVLINLQVEVSWIFANIAAAKEAPIEELKNSGIIEVFVKLLELGKEDHLDNVIHCLGNIAGSGYQNYLFDLNIHEILYKRLSNITNLNNNTDLLDKILWLISNLSIIIDSEELFTKIDNFIPICQEILQFFDNDELISNSLWVLYYSTRNSPTCCLSLIKHECYHRIVKLLHHKDKHIYTNALRIINNIAAFDDSDSLNKISEEMNEFICTETLLTNLEYMFKKTTNCVEYTCNTLTNLIVNNATNINKLIENKKLLELVAEVGFEERYNTRVRKEALMVLANLSIQANCSQVLWLVEDEFLRILSELFKKIQKNTTFGYIIMTGIMSVLRNGEEVMKLRGHNQNPFINEICDDLEFKKALESYMLIKNDGGSDTRSKAIGLATQMYEYFEGSDCNDGVYGF